MVGTLIAIGVNIVITIVGVAFTYGKMVQKMNSFEKKQDSRDNDISELRKWTDCEIQRQVNYRDTHFVTADIKRRLDEVNTIEINSRLARIEAMLDQIQLSLEKR